MAQFTDLTISDYESAVPTGTHSGIYLRNRQADRRYQARSDRVFAKIMIRGSSQPCCRWVRVRAVRCAPAASRCLALRACQD
jgi:hypothetical protein